MNIGNTLYIMSEYYYELALLIGKTIGKHKTYASNKYIYRILFVGLVIKISLNYVAYWDSICGKMEDTISYLSVLTSTFEWIQYIKEIFV